MIKELSEQTFYQLEQDECIRNINQYFQSDYIVTEKLVFNEQRIIPTFKDSMGLEWVLIPGGKLSLGISDHEIETALELAEEPFLSFEEMQPVQNVSIPPFLMLRNPLSVSEAKQIGLDIIGSIGPLDTALIASTGSLEPKYGNLPSECQWELACRGGSKTLFWNGNAVVNEERLPNFLGLEQPLMFNAFGLSSLYHGEWCSDIWRPSYSSPKEPESGQVIRGGASRFWPWQDEREWCGCVSAFRMSSEDTGGAGAAVRLVRAIVT